MNNNNEKNEHVLDILSRQWNNDFLSLSNEEISMLISNFFYQTFLIDITNLTYKINTGPEGCYVNFNISGEAYCDDNRSINSNFMLDDEIEGVDFEEEE